MTAGSSQAAAQQDPLTVELNRLEAQLEQAEPGKIGAALKDLAVWLEQLEQVTFAKTPCDENALKALYGGETYLAQRPDQADVREAWFKRAERVIQSLPQGEMRRYFNTGLLVARAQICLEHNEGRSAREWIDHALADNLDPRIEPLALLALAEIERQQGEKQLALNVLAKVEACLAKLGPNPSDNPQLRAQFELMRAQTYLDLGLPDRAWSSIELSKQAARDARSQVALDNAILVEVTLLLASDRAEDVVRLLQPKPSSGSAARSRTLPSRLQLRYGIALADRARVAPEIASNAAAVIEGVLADPTLSTDERRIAHMAMVDFEFRKGDLKSSRQHLDAARVELAHLLEAQDAGARPREEAEIEAFASHLLRAEKFDMESGQRQLVVLRDAFHRFTAQLKRIDVRPGGVGFLHFSTRRFILNELIELSIAVDGNAKGTEAALEELIAVQELGSLSRSFQQPPVSAAEVREVMTRRGNGVLVFLPDYHRTLILAFDAKSADLCVVAAAQGTWRPIVDQWLHELSSSPTDMDEKTRKRNLDAIESLGQQVAERAQLMPAQLRERLASWKSVTIVGADPMDGLPFECLPLEGKQTLGLRFAVDRAPSLPVVVQLEKRRIAHARPSPKQGGLWLVAAPLMPEWAEKRLQNLPRIPFSDANRAALQGPYPQLDHSYFFAEQATRAALEDPRLEFASVLQLTVHGIDVAGRERPAALVLRPMSREDDGLLDCDEVESLKHMPDTVVLSACGAASGELRYGEDGLNNLGGAFLRAGASCVVLSSQDLQVQATQALMEIFHQRLCAGDTRAESMRAARAGLALNPRFSHPFYHSFVVVVGLGQTAK